MLLLKFYHLLPLKSKSRNSPVQWDPLLQYLPLIDLLLAQLGVESFVVRSWVGVLQDIRVVLSSQDPYGFSFADSLGLILGFMLDPTLITRPISLPWHLNSGFY